MGTSTALERRRTELRGGWGGGGGRARRRDVDEATTGTTGKRAGRVGSSLETGGGAGAPVTGTAGKCAEGVGSSLETGGGKGARVITRRSRAGVGRAGGSTRRHSGSRRERLTRRHGLRLWKRIVEGLTRRHGVRLWKRGGRPTRRFEIFILTSGNTRAKRLTRLHGGSARRDGSSAGGGGGQSHPNGGGGEEGGEGGGTTGEDGSSCGGEGGGERNGCSDVVEGPAATDEASTSTGVHGRVEGSGGGGGPLGKR